MTSKEHKDLSGLCIHTITTKSWKIEEAAKNFSSVGVKGITIWRDALEEEISTRPLKCFEGTI